MRSYGNPVRNAIAFIYNARPGPLLDMTAEKLCERYGVIGRDARREVECKLLAQQAAERRRGA